MGSWRKLLDRMLAADNPCNFSFEDCQRVLVRLGFTLARNSGTSHRKFVLKRDGRPTVIVGILHPGSGPVKRWYVSDMLDTLRAHSLLPQDDGSNDE